MRPSIMSDGATTSAPASACDRACLHQHLDRLVVQHVAAVVDQAVLAMRGERIQGDVGDHAQLGQRVLERAHRALRQAVGVEGLGRVLTLRAGRRDRKQRHRRDTQGMHLARLGDQQVDTQALDARHRGHRLALPLAFDNKHRVDEVIGSEPVFAHQAAREIIPTHAPHAGEGVSGKGLAVVAHRVVRVTASIRQFNLQIAPVSGMIAPGRCDWTPRWSKNHSRSYGLSDKSARSGFGQVKPGPQGDAQGSATQRQVRACLTKRGPG